MAQAILPFRDTILHRGKDFAVSSICLHMTLPEGSLAFRHRRFCSHLSDRSGRALPATFPTFLRRVAVFGLSSLLYIEARPSDRNPYNITHFLECAINKATLVNVKVYKQEGQGHTRRQRDSRRTRRRPSDLQFLSEAIRTGKCPEGA